ncbi:MAG: phenylacetate--CoA ligase family protein [Solirubrobacterales bacterium]|nr:phenylacetate--CoA ligase family protein [Solirubrobacterales bacterium]
MTTIADTGLNALRARFGAALSGRLPAHIKRLQWDAERLQQHQRERLRALLTHAVERSPFHARRLHGIDPERFELEQLAELPVMSKEQMMASFDELLTDRRLTRSRAERHLAASTDEPSLLYDDYVCLASGGSSGLRGLFVQTVEEYVEFSASLLRRLMAKVFAAGGPPPNGFPVGLIGAAAPVHSSGFAAAVASGYPLRAISVPATLSIGELAQRLNDTQPPVLLAHTSKLVMLAGEQRAGRLRISPVGITAMAEQVSDEDRMAITEGFGVPPITQFTSTEGLIGHSQPGGAVVSFACDNCIAELVDADNRPVSDGVPSDKVLVTNLHNFTQPLIRYELTDRFVRDPAGSDRGHLRATVEGRADDVFRYGDIAVDPLVIRSVMVRTPVAREYQVRQSDRGIEIAVVADGALDRAALASALRRSLEVAGLSEARVRVSEVADIARHPETGKARRFIPL